MNTIAQIHAAMLSSESFVLQRRRSLRLGFAAAALLGIPVLAFQASPHSWWFGFRTLVRLTTFISASGAALIAVQAVLKCAGHRERAPEGLAVWYGLIHVAFLLIAPPFGGGLWFTVIFLAPLVVWGVLFSRNRDWLAFCGILLFLFVSAYILGFNLRARLAALTYLGGELY